ncbi:unnamed protein product [Ectocarpus sp. 8 AP-2014]
MLRFQSNEKETFSEILEASARETNDMLSHRRKVMDQAWDDIDEGWQALQEHMTEVGITKPLDSKEGMVMLNVGGSLLAFRRSVFEGKGKGSTSALGNLCEAKWDKRVPRDSDGRIVLDESPTCVKHLFHDLLTPPSSAQGTIVREDDFARDETPDLLRYTARVLGLSGRLAPIGMSIAGGTTIFEPHEASRLTAVVQGWCPGHPGRLELLYRASRDGWNSTAFQATCGDDSPSTVTFFRVKRQGTGGTDSIVGGFSSVPWTSTGVLNYCFTASPGAFLFMLKDGEESGSGSAPFQPMKWGIKDGPAGNDAVCRGPAYGPVFGKGFDLTVSWKVAENTLQTGNHTYEVPAESLFLSLDGRAVVDVETFRVCCKPTDTLASTKPNHHSVGDAAVPPAPVRTTDDVRTFGQLIACSLMQEEMVIQEARNELAVANARTTACAAALAAVYGPDVAKGREEDVVELGVRGTRVTTMRSTLRIFPDSSFATRFDEDRWPAAEKDLDDNGRRVIDCKPSVFSKVMDILRMAKRASWARGNDEQEANETPRVTIKPCDRAEFEEFVDMYFQGCESFIMEYVESLGDEEANR